MKCIFYSALACALCTLAGCSSVTEEHISASADNITFSRSTGKHAASGGFKLTKDSLVMRENKN